MQKFTHLTADQYNQVLKAVSAEAKPIIERVYTSRVCKVETLLKTFPELTDEAGVLMRLGKLNGVLWKKFKTSIHPVEVPDSIKDCAYSLGVLVEKDK